MSKIVELNNIVKYFERGKQSVKVLHGLNLDIHKGEFISLMGPSGSGKSTLLNIVAGLDKPASGSVTVFGQRIDQMSNANLTDWRGRNIGFIFQFYNLLPVLTAERNVEIPLLLTSLSASERRKRVAVALELVDLADRAKHRPNELSGGQMQRVSIARAIVTDPTIIVCDEPTGDLDRENADSILGLLELLNQQYGKTILMVTHDPLAAKCASRRIQMDKGLLVENKLSSSELETA